MLSWIGSRFSSPIWIAYFSGFMKHSALFPSGWYGYEALIFIPRFVDQLWNSCPLNGGLLSHLWHSGLPKFLYISPNAGRTYWAPVERTIFASGNRLETCLWSGREPNKSIDMFCLDFSRKEGFLLVLLLLFGIHGSFPPGVLWHYPSRETRNVLLGGAW